MIYSLFTNKSFKLCSLKLLVLLALVLAILCMYHTILLIYHEKLSGENIVKLYELTMGTLVGLYLTFAASNVLSKFKKVKEDEKVCD